MALERDINQVVEYFNKRMEEVKPSRSAALDTAVELMVAEVEKEKRALDSGTYHMESQKLGARERIEHLMGCVVVLKEVSEE